VGPVSAPAPARAPRIAAVDWLRGLAVLLMFQAHGFDSWLAPGAKSGPAYAVVRHMSGLPSRLFMLLVGVSVAIKLESQLARGVPSRVMRWGVAKRGLQILALAYLFRFQEWALSGFYGDWRALMRVDILNSIGASMLVTAAVSIPRNGRRAVVATAVAAAFFIALGPIVGPAHFPAWLPQPLTSYLGGQRPMSWFPIFPWAAWALVGVLLGHLWVHESRAGREGRAFLLTGAVGLLSTATVIAVRRVDPYILRYPSEFVQQMGPGSFFFRLGIVGALAALAWVVTRLGGKRFSPMRQMGQTSLLLYWVHVDLCYGYLSRPIQGKLGLAAATAWIAALALAMLGVSLLKTHYARPAAAWLAPRLRLPRAVS
jgi:uncharacterized membrane protein